MIDLARALMRIPPPRISKSQAIAIARSESERRGWSWDEPIRCEERLRTYMISTNTDAIGGNAYIVVNMQDGSIKGANLSRR
jgi:hypothetical protein